MRLNRKKGIQISNAFGAVLAVVLVAVLVIIAIFLFSVLSTGFTVNTTAVVNEKGWINGSLYAVDNVEDCNFQNLVVASATNGSGETILAATNYTVDSAAGTVLNTSFTQWHNVTFNYSYGSSGAACTASDDMVTQFATYPALVGLVGTIVFLGLVIGILVASFVFGGRRQV